MYVNACRKWTQGKLNRRSLAQDTQRNSLHTLQFVPCSDLQFDTISIFDKNAKEHNCQEVPDVMRLLAYVIQTLDPKDMDRTKKTKWNLVTADVTATCARIGVLPTYLTPKEFSTFSMLRSINTMSDLPPFCRNQYYCKLQALAKVHNQEAACEHLRELSLQMQGKSFEEAYIYIYIYMYVYIYISMAER